jgi:hypothetical protein
LKTEAKKSHQELGTTHEEGAIAFRRQKVVLPRRQRVLQKLAEASHRSFNMDSTSCLKICSRVSRGTWFCEGCDNRRALFFVWLFQQENLIKLGSILCFSLFSSNDFFMNDYF